MKKVIYVEPKKFILLKVLRRFDILVRYTHLEQEKSEFFNNSYLIEEVIKSNYGFFYLLIL